MYLSLSIPARDLQMCCWKVSLCLKVRTWILCRCWFACVSMCSGSTELRVILLVWIAWCDLQRDLGLLACHHSPTPPRQTPRSYNSTVTSKAPVTFLLQSHLSIIAAARSHGDSWFGVNWTLRVDTGINQYPLSVIPEVSHPGAIINHSTKPRKRLTARKTFKKTTLASVIPGNALTAMLMNIQGQICKKYKHLNT